MEGVGRSARKRRVGRQSGRPRTRATEPTPWLTRYARLLVAATLLLVAAGGMVTSTGSGLAVPDWPTTYGYSMFSFPLAKMVGGIFYEHGHRLIATTVGMLTIGLVIWLWRVEPRRWVRRLGLAALGVVILQGVLGGITVLFFLPDAISISHAGLAQIFFCLTVAIALVTSPTWRRSARALVDDREAAAPRCVHSDGARLPADPDWRDDAAHGRGSGDSGLSAGIRRAAAAGLDGRRSRCISRIASARWS